MIYVSASGDPNNYSNNPSSEDYSSIIQETSFPSVTDVVRRSARRMIALFRPATCGEKHFSIGLFVFSIFSDVNTSTTMSASCCSIFNDEE